MVEESKTLSNVSFLNLINDKDFIEKIVKMQNEDEVVEEFKKKGLIPTPENMRDLRSLLNKAFEKLKNYTEEEVKEVTKQYERLSDEGLSNIAGGEDFVTEEDYEKAIKDLKAAIVAARNKKLVSGTLFSIVSFASKLINPVAPLAVSGVGYGISWFQDRDLRKLENDLGCLIIKLENLKERSRAKRYYSGIAVGVGALALAYTFRKDIKAWFRR